MMKQGTTARTLVAIAALGASLSPATAQHYPAGAEGIRAATLPPPGIYLRDYNFVYFSPEKSLPVLDVLSYRNAPRVIWITGQKILGADYGMDVIVPFGYTEIEYLTVDDSTVTRRNASRFGLADIQIEPLLLSWHTKRFDFAAGYAVWAPTGDFDRTEVVNIGNGYWSHMLTAGATWNINEEKTWAVSLLNRYEISHEQEETGQTPGQQWTAEGSVSTVVAKGVEIGAVGYWRQTTTGDSAHVAAAGPEISALLPQVEVQLQVRYLREFAASHALEGNLVVMTLTKGF